MGRGPVPDPAGACVAHRPCLVRRLWSPCARPVVWEGGGSCVLPARVCPRLSLVRAVPSCVPVSAPVSAAPLPRLQRYKRFASVPSSSARHRCHGYAARCAPDACARHGRAWDRAPEWGVPSAVNASLQAQLQAQAEELRGQFNIEVQPRLVSGVTDEQLVALAESVAARLLVVAALGARQQQRWRLGSVAERVVQFSSIPALVVRERARLAAWARGAQPLRVLVGVERTSTARRALRWASALRDIGPCDLLVTQVVWPPGEHARRGVPAPMPLDHLRPELAQIAQRDLEAWAGVLEGPGETSFHVRPGLGRIDAHLTQLAAEAQADLLVVGTHQRAGIARLW